MDVGSNLIWRIMQQYVGYIMKLLVQIVLFRIVAPSELGQITVVLVFANLAEIIAVSGLGTALVQKLNPDEDDFSTVLSFSIPLSLILYGILFLSAPIISRFYGNPKLIPLLRIYCIVVFSQSYLAIINAYVQKHYLFKKSFFGCFFAISISGFVSIICAYNGIGEWSLVVYGMLSSFLSILFIQIFIKWHPKVGFKLERFVKLFSFSWKVLLSSLIGSLMENVYNLTIGKYYGDEALGYYKQGNTYPDGILGQTRIAFSAVMLPLYSSLQKDMKRLNDTIYKMTKIITSLIFPMAFGLAAISYSFVIVLLSEKWLPAVYYLRLECIFYGTLPITTSLSNGLFSIGRSDISAKIEVSKLLLTFFFVLLFHDYGIEFLCVGRIIIALLFVFATLIISHIIMGLSIILVIRSVIKPFIISALMGIVVYVVQTLPFSGITTLLIQVAVGIILYFLGMRFFMKDVFLYLKGMLIKKT